MAHLEMKLDTLQKYFRFLKEKFYNYYSWKYVKLSSELFKHISATNVINALGVDNFLFGQNHHVSEDTVKEILTKAELISTEEDLLTELG